MKIFSILLAILLTSDYLAAEQVAKVPKATKEFSADNAKTQVEFYGDPDDVKTVASSLSTKKTSCIQQSVYPDKTLDQQKKILIEKAKQESLEELYGALIFSSTDIENGKLKKDEIKSRAVGAVRVKGNPEFYNGKNLGEICADVTSYITSEDLEKYSPKKVSLKHFCFNDSSVAMKDIKDQARLAAYKEMIIQYKPSMKSISKEQAENLLHGFKESNTNFDFDTASYCFDAIGTILPYELEMSDGKVTKDSIAEAVTLQQGQLWKGFYTCGQGKTGLDLKITDVKGSEVKATFDFNYNDSAFGTFEMAGTYQNNELNLNPGKWIYNPNGYGVVGMRGNIFNNKIYTGKIMHSGCSSFELKLQ